LEEKLQKQAAAQKERDTAQENLNRLLEKQDKSIECLKLEMKEEMGKKDI